MNLKATQNKRSNIHKAMWFVKAICPTSIPRKKAEWNRHIRFYVWLLSQLRWLYARGAISDTINYGSLNVIHNVRDYWYEEELKRFGIDIDQHLNSHTHPIAIKREYRLPGIFNWTESIQLLCEGNSYTINRAKELTLETNMEGTLKVSTSKDLFLRTTFTLKNDYSKEDWQDGNRSQVQNTQPKSDIPSKKSTKKKITVKDTIPSKDTEPKKEIHITKHQGFEENDAF